MIRSFTAPFKGSTFKPPSPFDAVRIALEVYPGKSLFEISILGSVPDRSQRDSQKLGKG